MTLRAAHGWNAQFPDVPPEECAIEVARPQKRVTATYKSIRRIQDGVVRL
jgi:hypothetical protein